MANDATIGDIVLDSAAAMEDRAALLSRELGDLSCFRAGGVTVTLEFSHDAPALSDTLAAYLIRRKSGC